VFIAFVIRCLPANVVVYAVPALGKRRIRANCIASRWRTKVWMVTMRRAGRDFDFSSFHHLGVCMLNVTAENRNRKLDVLSAEIGDCLRSNASSDEPLTGRKDTLAEQRYRAAMQATRHP
jgi:hypothetical protein